MLDSSAEEPQEHMAVGGAVGAPLQEQDGRAADSQLEAQTDDKVTQEMEEEGEEAAPPSPAAEASFSPPAQPPQQEQAAAEAQPSQEPQHSAEAPGPRKADGSPVILQVQLPEDAEGSAPPSPSAEVSFSPPGSRFETEQEPEPAPQQQQQADQPARAPSPSALRSSMSPGETRAAKAAARRQQAAEWVSSLTGCPVPHDSDAAFRASLKDGVILCRLANVLRPGSISRIIDYSQECSSPTGGVIQSFENVANFIAATKELTGEADACLSAADLDDGDGGERPAVADCLLALHAWWQAQQAPPAGSVPIRAWGSRPTSPRPASPHPTSPKAPSPAPSPPAAVAAAASPGMTPPPPLRQPPSPHGASASEFSFTPHATAAVHRAAGALRGSGSDGLEYLMRTCNHMLKSNMGMPATPVPPPPRTASGVHSEIALEAVGPVLEMVMQDLIKEYEKRLLAKDQEFKLSLEAQERMRRDIARLKQDVAHWKEQAAAVKYLPAPQTELSAAEREAYEKQLREKEAAAAAEVARKEAELRAVQEEAAAHVADADAKLNELCEQVESYRGMQERYLQIAEENRQLYNTVQDLRGNIRVFCRVRPRGRTGDSSNCMVELGDEGQVQVFSQKHNKWHTYKFDKVFAEGSTQEAVYAETQPLIRSVLDGYNVCIFAYGQTGSGKTHTMSGTNIAEYAGRGLYYRALDDLFELNRERGVEVAYSISVQLLEIYNEAIRDLLVGDAEARQHRSLQLVNSQRSGSNVPDAIQIPVSCTEDVLEVMERGARNRAVAETRMNDRSSRSHQVLTVVVEGTNKLSHARTHGCLHLIDLAGSERVGKSGAEGQQLLEAQHINKSLSALGNVMHALASKSAHVPFRDSKLTQLLQDSLSGQAKTMMFMHVAPEANSVSETLSTLNFGKGVTEITLGAAKKNAESGAAWEAKERAMKSERDAAAAQRALVAEQQRTAELEAELEALRAQLARVGSNSSALSDDEGGTLRAYRPPAAPQAGAAAAPGGLTPRSRLALSSTAAAAAPPAAPAAVGGGRLTPRSGSAAGSRGLTPRSAASGCSTPRSGSVSQRPPQVSRLNLGGSSGSKLAAAPAAGVRPPMAKLNLQKLQQQQCDADENRTPLSARLSPASSNPNSARRTSPGSSTNWLVDASDGSDLSCSEDDSPMRSLSAAADRSPCGAGGSQQAAGVAAAGEAESFQLTMSPPRPLTARSAAAAAAAASSGGAPAARRAPVGRLPLHQLKTSSGSAGAAGSRLPQAPNSSRIPNPSPPTAAVRSSAHPSGSLTARPSLGRPSKSPPLSSSIPQVPLSAREYTADAAARRAALQQKTAPSSSLRRSMAAPGAAAPSMRRSASGTSDGGSGSGALNSARGVRGSSVGTRRWN